MLVSLKPWIGVRNHSGHLQMYAITQKNMTTQITGSMRRFHNDLLHGQLDWWEVSSPLVPDSHSCSPRMFTHTFLPPLNTLPVMFQISKRFTQYAINVHINPPSCTCAVPLRWVASSAAVWRASPGPCRTDECSIFCLLPFTGCKSNWAPLCKSACLPTVEDRLWSRWY